MKKIPSPLLHQSLPQRRRAPSKLSWLKRKQPRRPAQLKATTKISSTTKTPSSIRAKRPVETRREKYQPISRTQQACSALPAWMVSYPNPRSYLGYDRQDPRTGSSSQDLDVLLSANPRTKEEFQALSAQIVEIVIKRHQDKPLYPLFVEHHVRQLAEPLRDVEVRKAASGLTTLANEKQKEQRDKASGKKKPKSTAKPVLGAAKVSNRYVSLLSSRPVSHKPLESTPRFTTRH